MVGVAMGILWLGGIRGGVASRADSQGQNGLEHGSGDIGDQTAVASYGGTGWMDLDPGEEDLWPTAGADGHFRVIDACRYDQALQREHERILCQGHRVLWRVGEQLRDEAIESVKWTIVGSAVGSTLKAGCRMARYSEKAVQVTGPSVKVERGGLNLFKWNHPTSVKATDWKSGDYFLHLPDRGSPKANWIQNASRLRAEMRKGKLIFDSYREANGQLIPARGFLKAERDLLQNHGWEYSPFTGAWHPPGAR